MQVTRACRYLSLSSLLMLPFVLPPPAATQVREVWHDRAALGRARSKQTHPAPSPNTQQNTPDEILRLDTNLVTIPAIVIDRDGRYVTDLRKEDFQIFDDSIEQEVSFFEPVEKPFTILFLLDTSGSMGYRLADLGRAANAFLDQLRPDDQLIAASFDDKVRVLHSLATVKEIREETKLRLRTGGKYTMLYDAVDDALNRMKKVRGRKAIVLFSDGYGTGLFADAKRNIRDAEEQDALIYTIQFNTTTAEPPPDVSRENYFKQVQEGNNYMRDLARKTGGRSYREESLSDLGQTFGLVADELRRQYSLGYYPKKPLQAGQRREIKVKMRLLNLVVRARDSYIVKPSKILRR